MSYNSPSDDLDTHEIIEYLKLTTELSIPDLIRKIWKDGYEWGMNIGYENGQDDAIMEVEK